MVIPMLLAHICHVSLTCADMATVMPMRSAYYAHAFHAYMPCRPHVRRFGHGYAQTQLCEASCVLVCPHAKEQNKNRVEQPVLSLLLLPLFLHIDDARRILPLPSRRCFQQQFASLTFPPLLAFLRCWQGGPTTSVSNSTPCCLPFPPLFVNSQHPSLA
jgi:hypothetical protein